MKNRDTHSAANPMIMGGGDNGTFTNGERLMQADVPVETLLGAANGAVTGALISSGVSAAVTMGREGKGNIMRNITGNHLVAVLSGTAAFAALSGLIRFSRARMHNQWSDKHYAFLTGAQNHAGAVENEKDAPADQSPQR